MKLGADVRLWISSTRRVFRGLLFYFVIAACLSFTTSFSQARDHGRGGHASAGRAIGGGHAIGSFSRSRVGAPHINSTRFNGIRPGLSQGDFGVRGSLRPNTASLNHSRIAANRVRQTSSRAVGRRNFTAGQHGIHDGHHHHDHHHHSSLLFASLGFGPYYYGYGYYPYYQPDVCNPYSPYYDPVACEQLYYQGY